MHLTFGVCVAYVTVKKIGRTSAFGELELERGLSSTPNGGVRRVQRLVEMSG
jgi:hypothetical protein